MLTRLILLIFLCYVIFNQYIISGYERDMDKLMRANDNLLSSCTKLSEGEDLNEIYFR